MRGDDARLPNERPDATTLDLTEPKLNESPDPRSITGAG